MAGYRQVDRDSEYLPFGTHRMAYNAATHLYTFRDANGTTWHSQDEQGQVLEQNSNVDIANGVGHAEPTCFGDAETFRFWKLMGPWAIIVCVVLLLVFRFLPSGGQPLHCNDGWKRYVVMRGDSCWSLAETHGLRVDELVYMNRPLDCDHLWAGSRLCLPIRSNKEEE